MSQNEMGKISQYNHVHVVSDLGLTATLQITQFSHRPHSPELLSNHVVMMD